MSVSRGLERVGYALNDLAQKVHNVGQGNMRLHMGPPYIWTLPALQRHADAIHTRATQGCPAPDYGMRKTEAEPLALWDGVLGSVI